MKLFPVICGASFKNKGVQPMLDAWWTTCRLRSTSRRCTGVNPDTGETETREPEPTAPFSALAFKIMNDPFVGQLVFVRVYSGTLNAGSGVYNSTRERKERVGRLVRMHANKREEIESVSAGDIAAVVGLKDTRTGDTLCDPSKPIVLESMDFPDAGHRGRDRAQDQGRRGEARACRWPGSPSRTRPSGSTSMRRPTRR